MKQQITDPTQYKVDDYAPDYPYAIHDVVYRKPGRVWGASQGEGQGAAIIIALPAYKREVQL